MARLVFSLFFLVALHRFAVAQKVGDQVVVHMPVALECDGNTVDQLGPGQILKVLRVRPDHLWVSRGKPGWIFRSAVMPLEGAEAYFSRVFATGAGASDYLARGNVRIAMGKLDEGIADLRRAVDMANEKLPYHEALGYGLLANHDQVAAVASFDKALQINLTSASALMGRGLAYYQMGQAPKAQSDFERAIELQPTHAFPRKYLAALLHDEGKLDQAEQQLLVAIDLDRHDAFSRKVAGRLLYERGRYENALEQFEFVCSIDPDDTEALAGKGVLLHAIGKDLNAAKGAFESAIAISKPTVENAFLWSNLGQVQTELAEFELALESLNRAVELDPLLNEARSQRAWLLCTQYSKHPEQVEVAKADVNLVLRSSDPKTYWDCRAAAKLFFVLGQPERATVFQREAIDKVQTSAPVRFREIARHELVSIDE